MSAPESPERLRFRTTWSLASQDHSPTQLQVDRYLKRGSLLDIEEPVARILDDTDIRSAKFVYDNFVRKYRKKGAPPKIRTGKLNNFIIGLTELEENGYDPDDIALVIGEDPDLMTRRGKLHIQRIMKAVDELPFEVLNTDY